MAKFWIPPETSDFYIPNLWQYTVTKNVGEPWNIFGVVLFHCQIFFPINNIQINNTKIKLVWNLLQKFKRLYYQILSFRFYWFDSTDVILRVYTWGMFDCISKGTTIFIQTMIDIVCMYCHGQLHVYVPKSTGRLVWPSCLFLIHTF